MPLDSPNQTYTVGERFSKGKRYGGAHLDFVDHETGELMESRTKQEMKDACDINNIVRQNRATGMIDHGSLKQAMYGDFSSTMSFHEARNAVATATQAFDKLPHEIRTRFGNDAANLVDFMSDDANIEEAKQLGLYDDGKEEEGGETPAVETPTETPASGETDPG